MHDPSDHMSEEPVGSRRKGTQPGGDSMVGRRWPLTRVVAVEGGMDLEGRAYSTC